MLSRRQFVRALSLAPLVAPALPLTAGTVSLAPDEPRALRFLHTHTGERLTVEYFDRNGYAPDALATINHFLRDFRTGDVRQMDPALLDLLHTLARHTESARPFEVISAYRSPKTNAQLRAHTEGVAAGSLHMVGQAIDIRLTDVPLPKLRDAARVLKAGGVGYYPASDFVHVDTGRVRTW